MGLLPESIPNAAKGAESIRWLLSNLGNAAQWLGEPRNLYGTGLGKRRAVQELRSRHARLAVGVAWMLPTFLERRI
ncbi:abortive infection family protein [Cupriavidus gilardii]|uniref:abortive infection family protein n=1 Tax=Cupriavidus gilardii TaxID=82541 RepID=UPI003B8A80DF